MSRKASFIFAAIIVFLIHNTFNTLHIGCISAVTDCRNHQWSGWCTVPSAFLSEIPVQLREELRENRGIATAQYDGYGSFIFSTCGLHCSHLVIVKELTTLSFCQRSETATKYDQFPWNSYEVAEFFPIGKILLLHNNFVAIWDHWRKENVVLLT